MKNLDEHGTLSTVNSQQYTEYLYTVHANMRLQYLGAVVALGNGPESCNGKKLLMWNISHHNLCSGAVHLVPSG